ncbi:hypothetical protein OGAPHI_005164 [Ogataea philodendri]|uniref:DHHA2 domain-containing protein n=1 Tax=Ogataea philodendri TaxID=1378263 RepID=A0A9P8P2R2_9ASCO|nr:uncharacterized protein OGAPHI_005164 [Ogataea philodendri]KAH3663762.1 hypothetical protein OGAPHI_005164 [Ogataea philodendri]
MLANYRQILRNLGAKSKLTLVTGNQSADMDSTIAALAYSYLCSKKDVIPVLNIPRADFKLRKDIVHVMDISGVDTASLVFLDDLESSWEKLSASSIDLVLVDHNKPQGSVIQDLISKLNAKVVSILDHHDDEKLFLDANPRIVQKCGSCTSLVITHFKEQTAKIDPKLAKMFISPILIDTNRLRSHVESVDTKAYDLLTLRLNAKPDFSDNYAEELFAAKNNVEGLSMLDLLRKDYKEYDTVGISSLTVGLSYLQKFEVRKSLEAWKNERHLDVVIILTAYRDKYGFNRELMVYGDPDKLDTLLDHIKGPLGLTQTRIFPYTFRQRVPKFSRKQVAPLVQEWLESE